MIEEESGTPLREMYQVFNMGHRLEVYCDEKIAENLVAAANVFNIGAQIVGRVEDTEGGEKLTIKTPRGVFEY